jgi:hypothetical protein
MKIEKAIQKYIDSYEKERVLMNVKEFDHLLKRVNIEEDTAVKQHILNVIEKYLDVVSANEVIVPDVQQTVVQAESIQEDVILPTTEELSLEEAEMNQQNASINYAELHEAERNAIEAAKAESVQTELIIEEPTQATATVEVPVAEAEATPVVHVVTVTEPVVQITPEEVTVVGEVNIERVDIVQTLVDDTEYVEEFGLISTTKEEHMKETIARGGVIFRDKRSFMLMLCLDNEVVAIAKTIKLEQFPEHVQKHLKNNGFISCDIVSFGEITKRSRARYTNVTYRNLQLLAKDH